MRRQETEAGQRTREVEQPLEHVCPSLIADAQAAAAEQPRERPLHPAVPAEPFRGVDPPPGDPRGDAAGTQGTA